MKSPTARPRLVLRVVCVLLSDAHYSLHCTINISLFSLHVKWVCRELSFLLRDNKRRNRYGTVFKVLDSWTSTRQTQVQCRCSLLWVIGVTRKDIRPSFNHSVNWNVYIAPSVIYSCCICCIVGLSFVHFNRRRLHCNKYLHYLVLLMWRERITSDGPIVL